MQQLRSAWPLSAASASPADGPTSQEFTITEKTPGPAFADLGVKPEICSALARHDIVYAFPIQALTLPQALSGTDLIGQAKTGTGKTLGFGIPIVQRIVNLRDPHYADLPKNAIGKPQALVVVPTRELAIQVASDLETAGADLAIRVCCIYGGRAYEPQIDQLNDGVDVVVGTPGRLLDLFKQRHLDLSHIRILVLDEADEMLDMGFLPDVERIVAAVPDGRQTMLFSATMPGQIISMARRYMNQPIHMRAQESEGESSMVDLIEQHVWRTHPLDKPELVGRILQAEGCERTIVFCRTKRAAQKLADELVERGFSAASLHGDLGQGAREKALNDFRSAKVATLVATDVAARGIDVEAVTHVINYECPEDDKTLTHRIGRTGRAGASGVAITFVDWPDTARWQMINRTLGLAFNDPIETYSSSDHVYTGLNIPRDVKGRLIPAPPTPAKKPGDGGSAGTRGASGGGRGQQRSGEPVGGGRSGGASASRDGGRNRSGGAGATKPVSNSSSASSAASQSANSTGDRNSNRPARARTRTRKPTEG